MAQTELYRESFVVISVDPDTSILYADWKGYQSVDSIRQGCEAMLSAMTQRQTFKILNDNTHVVGIWRVAAEWIAGDWFPRMKQAGMQQFAWVYSPAKLSQLSTDTTLSLMDPELYDVKVFYEAQEAAAWLLPGLSGQKKGTAENRMTRALVIEDNADFSRLFRDMLEIMGCVVEVTSNAEAGLKAARRSRPDIIFCDIGLPGQMNGYEFARQVRSDPEMDSMALIAVSGLSSDEDRMRASDAGFDRVFSKPVKFVDVSKALTVFGRGRQ